MPPRSAAAHPEDGLQQLSLLVDASLKQLITSEAEALGVSLSDVIRMRLRTGHAAQLSPQGARDE